MTLMLLILKPYLEIRCLQLAFECPWQLKVPWQRQVLWSLGISAAELEVSGKAQSLGAQPADLTSLSAWESQEHWECRTCRVGTCSRMPQPPTWHQVFKAAQFELQHLTKITGHALSISTCSSNTKSSGTLPWNKIKEQSLSWPDIPINFPENFILIGCAPLLTLIHT